MIEMESGFKGRIPLSAAIIATMRSIVFLSAIDFKIEVYARMNSFWSHQSNQSIQMLANQIKEKYFW